MVYKKYIKRDGKTFGPYYYESYRDGDKVKTRFVSGPSKKDEMIGKIRGGVKKNGGIVLFFVLGIFLLLLIGNLNYNFNLTGHVISEDEGVVEQEVSLEQVQIAEQMAEEDIVSSVDVRDVVDVEVKDKFLENNKVMEFDTPEGMIELSFDLLNYSEFVEKEAKGEIEGEEGVESLEGQEAENFDIVVEESKEKYKWGYDIKLTDLNFMAKIDVKSEKEIVIIDNQTLKIGDNYLSFADLTEQGYVLTINQPVVLEEVNLTGVDVSLNMTNIIEMNVSLNITNMTDVNLTDVNLSDVNVSEEIINVIIPENVTEVNITEVNLTDTEITSNISEEDVGEDETGEIVDGVVEDGEDINDDEVVDETEEEISEVIEEEEVVGDEEISEDNVEQPIEEEVEEVEEVIEEELEVSEPEPIITGNVIRGITGFVVNGFKGITGFSVSEENKVSIYIQRDFNGTNYSLGDVINLDPFLIILITKASHLDSDRIFISDIYDEVKEQDGNWSGVVDVGEYVRVVFEQNLTSEKDITIYARANESSEIGVYRKDGDEEIARFVNVLEEELHKIYLTNLSVGEEMDTFDLRVLGGGGNQTGEGFGVEFDWIVDPLSGTGTVGDPYQIANCIDLNETRDNLTAYYILTQDIDCSDTINWDSGAGFEPIGKISGWPEFGTPFSGIFDGQNHTITNLYINRTEEYYTGLFGYMGTGSKIENFGLININISADNYTGGLVGSGDINSNISFCFVTGNVSGYNYVGGLVGGLGSINNSYAKVDVEGNNFVGGLVGYLDSDMTIYNSYATGNVNGGINVGGLVGWVNFAYLENSFATGNVTGSSSVGGLFGGDADSEIHLTSYYNNHSGNPSSCGGGWSQCIAILDNESYFYDVQEEPMISWSYPPWSNTNDDADYPILDWQASETSPIVGLTVIYPDDLSALFNATQNAFFNVTLNVSCVQGSCGTANVSLALKKAWCYQETANVSTACGGLDMGLYSSSGTWSSTEGNLYDGIWATSGQDGSGLPSSLYINYSKPSRALNTSLWRVSDNADVGVQETVNLTINQSCWDFNSSYLALRVQSYTGSCLDGDTLVLMQDGERKISELSEGDLIYSYDSQEDKLELTEIENIINRSIMVAGGKYYYIYYYIEDREQLIKATWNHKFYVDGKYVFAEDLREGDILLDSLLQEREITKIEVISNAEDYVWDLTVKENHNFFANDILVHNDLANAGVEWSCWNNSAWVVMRLYNATFHDQVYEEAMWWSFDEKLMNISEGATPFYTNASTNPLTSSSLDAGGSELITFWVNATEVVGTNYDFFAYVNLTSNLSIFNASDDWNVSIVAADLSDSTSPVSNLQAPTNHTSSTSATNYFNATFTDETGLQNSTLYIWNSTDIEINVTTTEINGVSNSTNISVVLPRYDNYTWNYLVYDNSSNSAWNATNWSFEYYEAADITLPNINITSPQNNSNTTDVSKEVNYTASDETALDVCWWSNDGGASNITLASCGTNITGQTWDEGLNNITVWVNDSSDNVNLSYVQFRLDTTPPDFEYDNLSVLTNETSELLLNLNATDNGIGILDGFAVNWTDTFTITYSDGNISNSSAIFEGYYWINASVNDTLGNINYSIILVNVTNATTLDLIVPNVNITYPLNTTYNINVSMLNYSTSDETALDRCWWSNSSGVWNSTSVSAGFNWSGLESVEESNNWTVYCNDTSGNENSSIVMFFKTAISSCVNLTRANTEYVLIGDIVEDVSGNCFNILANNITLDFNGYNVTDTSILADNYGVSINGYNETTIKDGEIYNFGKGISNTNGYNNNFSNMIVYSNGAFGDSTWIYGIYLNGGKNNSIVNNNLTMIHTSALLFERSYGIYLTSSLNNKIENNLIYNNSGSDDGQGIYVFSGSNNNQFLNNTVNLNKNKGIYIDSSSNNTLINNTANSNNYGIYFASSSNNTLINNTANSNSLYGVTFLTSSNNTLINNTLNLNERGIYLASSSNNTLTSNTINSNNFAGYFYLNSNDNQFINNIVTSNNLGIYFYLNSRNNITNNYIWNCSSDGVYACISVSESDYNVFDSNKINLSGKYGIWIKSSGSGATDNADHNLFKNMNLTNIAGTSVFIDDDGSNSENLNNTFLNVSYNNESVDSRSELIRKWYYQAYVNDSWGKDVLNANVSAFNSSGSLIENLTTNVNGWTEIGELIDYVNNGAKNYYSNYIIYADNVTHSINHNYNVSYELNNLMDIFSLSLVDLIPPNINIISPQNNSNTTDVSKEVNYTASDETALDVCWWSNDDAASNITLASCGTNITGQTWDEGLNNITVWANDSSDNVNLSYVQFRLDTTFPSFSNLANQSILDNNSLSYDINAVDIGVGLSKFSINWTTTFSINEDTGVLINVSALSIREYWINVSVNDTLGNTNETIFFVNVTNHSLSDNVAPVISFSCSPTSVYTGDVVTCSCSAVDVVDTSPSVSYTANPSTSSAGSFTTTCTATDSSGNSASSSVSYSVSSSGGGGCVSECFLGETEIDCINSTTYKNRTCGDYDSDSCLEWKESYGIVKLIPTSWTGCIDGKREKVFYDPVCHTEPYTETISCGCVIDFKKGLNFISICALQSDYTISRLLSKLEGNYEYILEWDGVKKDYNLWNKQGTREFDSFDKDKSYFIYYTGESMFIELGGELYGGVEVPLYSGLNSPVYPYEQDSQEISNIDFYDSSFEYILDWDNLNKQFRLYNSKGTQEINNIEFGKGLYMYSFEDKLNYVPPER